MVAARRLALFGATVGSAFLAACDNMPAKGSPITAPAFSNGNVVEGVLEATFTQTTRDGRRFVRKLSARHFRAPIVRGVARMSPRDRLQNRSMMRLAQLGEEFEGPDGGTGGGGSGVDAETSEMWQSWGYADSVFDGADPLEWTVDSVAHALPWGTAEAPVAPQPPEFIALASGDTVEVEYVSDSSSPLTAFRVSVNGALTSQAVLEWDSIAGGAVLRSAIVTAYDGTTELSRLEVTASDIQVAFPADGSTKMQLALLGRSALEEALNILTPADAVASSGCLGAHIATALAGATLATAAFTAPVAAPILMWASATFVGALTQSIDCEAGALEQQNMSNRIDELEGRVRELENARVAPTGA